MFTGVRGLDGHLGEGLCSAPGTLTWRILKHLQALLPIFVLCGEFVRIHRVGGQRESSMKDKPLDPSHPPAPPPKRSVTPDGHVACPSGAPDGHLDQGERTNCIGAAGEMKAGGVEKDPHSLGRTVMLNHQTLWVPPWRRKMASTVSSWVPPNQSPRQRLF